MAKKINELIREENTRAVFAKVFDRNTILALHALAKKGFIDYIEHVISTGKEAHVFLAKDPAGNTRAVKIYKTVTSDFKHMRAYIEGDLRFKGIPKNKRALVNEWTRKEFRNLEVLNKVGIRVPLPLGFHENALVMEFIGEDENAAPLLKNKPVEDIEKLREQVAEIIAVMVEKAQLIHADLSEYNILNLDDEPIIIDCGQAVLTSHPKAEEFFNRDVKNMSSYFTKNGLKTTEKAFLEQIRSFKKKS